VRTSIRDALEQRTGLDAARARDERRPVPGGASWGRVLGPTTVVLFAVLFVTGAALGAVYAPAPSDAWASLVYVEQTLPLGALLRALHAHAHSAIIVVATLHLARGVVAGAYRAPRELVWWSGLAALGLLPVFSLTGYLLPYDQLAYWATKVRMGIVSAPPLVGPWIPPLLLGGNDVGALSLTRFFTLHVVVLPALFVAGLVVHRALARRADALEAAAPEAGAPDGPTPSADGASPRVVVEPYAARQRAFDRLAAAVVVAALLAVAARVPAHLGPPADPAQTFIARPEWYFLSLFQLLKYFEGPLDLVGKLVVPGLAVAYLAALPFLDRAPSAALAARRLVLAPFAVIALGVAGLTAVAVEADRQDPELAAQQRVTAIEAARARSLAAAGVPVEGPAHMLAHDPLTRGARVFRRACVSCHPVSDPWMGDVVPEEIEAPDLTGFGSRAWIRQVLRDPDSPRLYGRTKLEGMESIHGKVSDAELTQLVDYLYRLREPTPPTAEEAGVAELLDAHDCDSCHDFEEAYGADGPALFGYGARAWVRGAIAHPESDVYYGAANTMPNFDERLSAEDLDAVTTYVLTLEASLDPRRWPAVDDPGPVPTPRVKTASTSSASATP
jgi:ubiquinol-cytochrome c reductase cytochrome b subunit